MTHGANVVIYILVFGRKWRTVINNAHCERNIIFADVNPSQRLGRTLVLYIKVKLCKKWTENAHYRHRVGSWSTFIHGKSIKWRYSNERKENEEEKKTVGMVANQRLSLVSLLSVWMCFCLSQLSSTVSWCPSQPSPTAARSWVPRKPKETWQLSTDWGSSACFGSSSDMRCRFTSAALVRSRSLSTRHD